MASYIAGNVLSKDGLGMSSCLTTTILLDLLIPGTHEQLIFSQQEIALKTIARSRLGETILGTPGSGMLVLLLFGKVQLETTRFAIDRSRDALDHVTATMGTKHSSETGNGIHRIGMNFETSTT
ncbi:MAG: hypothetical protein ACK5TW_00250, partial [Cyanobacteriota bacterium]